MMLAISFVSVFILVVQNMHISLFRVFHECPFSCDDSYKARLALPYVPQGIL